MYKYYIFRIERSHGCLERCIYKFCSLYITQNIRGIARFEKYNISESLLLPLGHTSYRAFWYDVVQDSFLVQLMYKHTAHTCTLGAHHVLSHSFTHIAHIVTSN